MVERYVMAVDQGTTSTRCILFDHSGRLVAVTQREHKQYYPKPGWVEHDPIEIWHHLERIAPQALAQAGATSGEVVALGIANQRETTVLWDRHTGLPVSRAIVWQDTRTDALVDELSRGDEAQTVRKRSGLPPATRISIGAWDRGVAAAPAVADLMADLLGWSDEAKKHEVARYLARVAAERESQTKPDDDSAEAAQSRIPDTAAVL
jgi:glycerol kinase